MSLRACVIHSSQALGRAKGASLDALYLYKRAGIYPIRLEPFPFTVSADSSH